MTDRQSDSREFGRALDAHIIGDSDDSTDEETICLTGREAIDYARKHGLTLCKYADPAEGCREGLTLDEAEAVAREDPGLVYVEIAADDYEEDASDA